MRMEIVPVLRQALHEHGHKNVELEFRVGRILNGAFVTGVPKSTFEALMTVLSQSKAFSKTTTTTLEKLNGTDARYVIKDGDEANGVWCYKKKLYAANGQVFDACQSLVPRAAVALEGNDHSPPPPGSPPFKYHRLKKRTSFVHTYWTIDLTRVTSNLPGDFDNDEEKYEVEVELAGVDAYLIYTLDHLCRWGEHILREVMTLAT